jgi:hypothetical protein
MNFFTALRQQQEYALVIIKGWFHKRGTRKSLIAYKPGREGEKAPLHSLKSICSSM